MAAFSLANYYNLENNKAGVITAFNIMDFTEKVLTLYSFWDTAVTTDEICIMHSGSLIPTANKIVDVCDANQCLKMTCLVIF